ncbi:MAG TPA: hypothetical protein VE825_06560 [Terriglobales bacterium]|jgi:hypothetical protein|nr:hypothetical protein [Terriglobales bacterium]
MAEQALFRLMALVQRLGVGLSWLAWITVAVGALLMAWVLRGERRAGIWMPAAIMGLVALAANLADYFVTLRRSPDLALEANPLWRLVVDRYGLAVARWYGLTGKILVSILAAEMTAYYLAHRHRLFPEHAGSLAQFVLHLGSRCGSRGERLAALFTVFAFFFAGLNLLYFYIAYTNWLQDPVWLDRLPSAPVAVMMVVAGLAISFVLLTWRAFVGASERRTR